MPSEISKEIQVWPIDKLVAYARNPRKNDAAVERMCGSIREFGFKIPCLVRSDGEVIDGQAFMYDAITFLTPNVKSAKSAWSTFLIAGGTGGSDPDDYDASASLLVIGEPEFGESTQLGFQSSGIPFTLPVGPQLIFGITGDSNARSQVGSAYSGTGAQGPVPGANATFLATLDFQSFLDSMGNPVKFSYSTYSNTDLQLPGGTFVPAPSGGADCQSDQAIHYSGPYAFAGMAIDVPHQRLYVPAGGEKGNIQVLDLPNLASVGEISNVDAQGVAISTKSLHGFSASNPVIMWDSESLRVLKTIPLGEAVSVGAIVEDPSNDLVYLFHRESPMATIIRASDGSTVAEVVLNGIAKEAVTDGAGNIYAGIQSSDGYLVDIVGFSANGLPGVNGHWFASGEFCSGLAMDGTNGILFATCGHSSNGLKPGLLTAFRSGTGVAISGIPILSGGKSAAFNPATRELYSLQNDGSLMIVKESSPTSFLMEQYVVAASAPSTPTSLALDSRTGLVYVGGSLTRSDGQTELTLSTIRSTTKK